MTRRLTVTDPVGDTHVIEFTAGAVHGAENLAHSEPNEPRELRDALIGELLDRMHVTGHGTYRGYHWHE